MKKKVILLAAMFAGATTFAQDLTSKKGETILPEAGDWAIQFDATPFLNYAGNLFNSNANAPGADWLGNEAFIAGKYFVDANTAYRAKLGLNFGSATTKTLVADLSSGAAAGSTVEDVTKVGGSSITLGGGIEMRRGNTRLQGYYGGELLITLSGGGKTTQEYGNSFSDEFNANGTVARLKEQSGGGTFGLALQGFIGAEYFIAPKISIGAEYTWGLGFASTGKVTTTTEIWDVVNNNQAADDVSESGTSSQFGIGADIAAGGAGSALGQASLVATFHF